MSNPDPVSANLRRRWWAVAAISLVALALGAVLLSQAGPPALVIRWAGLSGGVAALQLALLRRHLSANRRPAETALLPDLGPGNLVTLGRGLAIAGFCGFAAAPLPLPAALAWAPAALYALSVLPDFLDGWLARATNRVTVLGGVLDMEYDSLAMLAVSVLAVRLGKVPWWFISLGLARYLFVAGIAWRQRRGRPIFDLTPSSTRRLAAGFQMGFFCVALWPIFGPPATTIAGILFVTPILVGFVRDWLIVSGAMRPTTPAYRWLLRRLAWGRAWIPPVLRGIGAGIALLALIPALRQAGANSGPGTWAALIFALAAALSAVSLLLGAGARLGAIGLLGVACAALAWQGYQPWHGLLLCAAIPLMYTGAGRAALWRGEDALFARRFGEPR